MSTTPPPSPWLLTSSERLYRSLLQLYPRDFRRTYQREMLITFHSYVSDTLQAAGPGGLLRMWSLVLYDLLTTTFVEHYRSAIQAIRQLSGLEQESFMTNLLLHLDVGAQTDIGQKRLTNEDSMLSVLPSDPDIMQQRGALFIVADGLGGHAKGEEASKLITEEVNILYYANQGPDLNTTLLHAVEQANRILVEQNTSEGRTVEIMGTTCIAAVLHNETAYIANVGDSRAYLIHEGEIKQVTLDHSFVVEQIREGKITPEEAKTHPQRNVITRCMGVPEVAVDLFTEHISHGDTLVLCSDGITGNEPESPVHSWQG
ncbi:PP2C family protein-serine/threonine phosphatase [Dictyobacter arantiisoli]|uniref:PPM-type phosphatase domain-containing protein n=1 Tax=Dictyobacter arantiisoli TaxID=2014874 RepID=A0A5A5TJZ7_9CHLR|nr:protein phosphatase 2C domain-containing protein [Dictyobacter arantiisoli]GCF11940.1 hypothetical protein KDI_55040 [Dictyobacter arantiisoli]